MDLHTDTLHALDWHALCEALAKHARTPMGRNRAAELTALPDLNAVHAALDATDEVLLLERDGGWVPISDVLDATNDFGRAARAAVLDKESLRRAGLCLAALDKLAAYLLEHERDVPVLQALAVHLQVDPSVTALLHAAFDETGDLSARTYPELGELRQRIHDLHLTIRRTLDELVHGDTLADVLQDRFVTQRGDRYVLPVKANFKRKELGIVHGMSGSGNTAFVEPHQVVVLNNELKLAEGRLEVAERRILAALSAVLTRVADRALSALDVATTIDLAAARAGLAVALDATRPIVREDGVLHLTSARHPVLALRGLAVVANDLRLGAQSPILVISGPNTGGKTVALKTAGLCALMVRAGCHVPAAEGSRVDLFHTVIALIGDHQTVHGDHSSFSSHLLALSTMLEAARPGCLYLVDEIASGTDPQQGAALAHAVLEVFLERGPRAVITTHFHRLKTVSALDPRFLIGGMQFADGRPTYRLLIGASGESHALETAERIGLPAALIERARALMGEGERTLADTLAALDRERARNEEVHRHNTALTHELAAQRDSLAAKEARIEARARELEQKQAAAFIARLDRAEKAISAVVADLQRSPSHAGVGTARTVIEALRPLAPRAAEPESPPAPADLAPGDRVKLRKVGKIGELLTVGERQLQVLVGGLTLTVKRDDVERLDAHGQPAPPPARPRPTPEPTPARKRADLHNVMRHSANTVDLRGLRVDEAIEAVEAFFARATATSQDVVFLLHGHGTGRMKQAVRQWLPGCGMVEAWAPAMSDQGGDAYTVAALR
jgi:DNA mismatch repair protein MutS2